MAKILAIANQKGGCGKSTTAVHLSAALKLSGKRVLLVDFDPQGDSSSYMGFNGDEGRSISDIMQEYVSSGNGDIHEIIQTSEKNKGIEYVPSEIGLAGAEMYFISAMSRETVLKRLLSQVKDEYDYIIIDCQPSLGILVINALVAADGVIIPAQAQEFSRKALKAITNIIEQVQRVYNPDLKFLGILPTMVDNTSMSKETMQTYNNNFGEQMFPVSISRSVTAAYSSRDKKALCFKGNSKLGGEYKAFAEEVIKRCNG